MEERTAREMWDAAMAEEAGLELVEWMTKHDQDSDEVVEGFALTGRWTGLVAGAKTGKSLLLVSMSVELSEGRDPWTGDPRAPLEVLYIDAEMGRLDLEERLEDCGYDPLTLERWHACVLPPRLDTAEGAAALFVTVARFGIRLVVVDGLNGTVAGAERDDTPWRHLYEHTMRRLKDAGVAVVTADNLGKDTTLGPRGSSVKLDKADAVVQATRTEGGVSLHATHRRTAAYAERIELEVVGLDGTHPVRYRRAGGKMWPDGTHWAVELLDELEIPPHTSRTKAREVLRRQATEADDSGADGGRYRMRNDVLGAALRWRRERQITPFQGGDRERETPGRGPVDSGDGALRDSTRDESKNLQGPTPVTSGDEAEDRRGQLPESEGAGVGVSRKGHTPAPDRLSVFDEEADPERLW